MALIRVKASPDRSYFGWTLVNDDGHPIAAGFSSVTTRDLCLDNINAVAEAFKNGKPPIEFIGNAAEDPPPDPPTPVTPDEPVGK